MCSEDKGFGKKYAVLWVLRCVLKYVEVLLVRCLKRSVLFMEQNNKFSSVYLKHTTCASFYTFACVSALLFRKSRFKACTFLNFFRKTAKKIGNLRIAFKWIQLAFEFIFLPFPLFFGFHQIGWGCSSVGRAYRSQ